MEEGVRVEGTEQEEGVKLEGVGLGGAGLEGCWRWQQCKGPTTPRGAASC